MAPEEPLLLWRGSPAVSARIAHGGLDPQPLAGERAELRFQALLFAAQRREPVARLGFEPPLLAP